LPTLPYGEWVVPLLVAQEGERAAKRYVEFFAANIRNPNTRRAYARAAGDFLGWCERRALTLPAIEPVHVAAYVEQLLQTGLPRGPGEPPAPLAAPSVKQQLTAIACCSTGSWSARWCRTTRPPPCAARSTSSRAARRRCCRARTPRR
jgi:hypothetical protein